MLTKVPNTGRGPADSEQREAGLVRANQPQASSLLVLDRSQIKILAEWIRIFHRWRREKHGIPNM